MRKNRAHVTKKKDVKEPAMKTKLLIILIVSMLVIALTACGQSYVGTWYNIEQPDGLCIVISKDKTFTTNNGGSGTVSELEDGIMVIGTNGNSAILKFGKYNNTQVLIESDAYGQNQGTYSMYVNSYEKATKLFAELHKEEVERKEKYESAYVGTWYRVHHPASAHQGEETLTITDVQITSGLQIWILTENEDGNDCYSENAFEMKSYMEEDVLVFDNKLYCRDSETAAKIHDSIELEEYRKLCGFTE